MEHTVNCESTEQLRHTNVYMALEHDLDVLPVINKIDLPSAEPQRKLKNMV